MAEVLLNFKVSTLCETLVSVADPLIHPKTVSSILKLVEFGPELVDRESIPEDAIHFSLFRSRR